MLGWMKSGQLCRNMIGQRGHKLTVINWGAFCKACLFIFFSIVCCLGDKDVSFLQVQGWYLSHEGLKDRGKSEKPSHTYHFLLQLKVFNMLRYHVLVQCVLNPINFTFKDSYPNFKMSRVDQNRSRARATLEPLLYKNN